MISMWIQDPGAGFPYSAEVLKVSLKIFNKYKSNCSLCLRGEYDKYN
jgi:hypothetical protein